MSDPSGSWAAPSVPLPTALPPPVSPAAAYAGMPSYAGIVRPVATGPARVVPLRPHGVGELLDGAVNIVRSCPRPVFALSAFLAVAGALVQLLVILTVLRPLAGTEASRLAAGRTVDLTGSAGLGTVVTLLVSIALGSLLTGAISVVVGRTVLGGDLGVGAVWRQLRERLLPLVAVSVLVPVVVAAALVAGALLAALLVATAGSAGAVLAVLPAGLAVVAALLLSVRWSLAPAVVVLERTPVRRALSRSQALVRHSFWRVLGVLVLALSLAALVRGVLTLPFHLLAGGGLLATGTLTARQAFVEAVGTALSATLVGPFTAGVRTLLYLDRRMRAEGLDIVLAAAGR